MPLEPGMEAMRLEGSLKPLPPRGPKIDSAALEPSHGAQGRLPALNHEGPQDCEPRSPEGSVNAGHKAESEAGKRSNGVGDGGIQAERVTELASTSPLFPGPHPAGGEEMVRWVKEQRRCQPGHRLHRGVSVGAPAGSKTTTKSCTAYYPLELDIDDDPQTSTNSSKAGTL